MRPNSTSEIRKQNAFDIVRNVIDYPDTTIASISQMLGVSVSTVSNIVSILRNEGLLMQSGSKASSGGRKAFMLTVNPEYAYFVGLSITMHTVKSVLCRADGMVVKQNYIYRTFEDSDAFSDYVYEIYRQTSEGFPDPSGVVITLPGHFLPGSSDIVRDDGIVVDVFKTDKICRRFKDVKGFMLCESSAIGALPYIRSNPMVEDCVYVSISRGISGTIIVDGHIVRMSDNDCNFGKMIVGTENNKPLTFASRCSSSYIIDSLKTLGFESIIYENSVNLPFESRYAGFFREIREGNQLFITMWDKYLHYLSVALINIYSQFGLPIVISGDNALIISQSADKLSDCISAMDSDVPRDIIRFRETGLFDDPIGAALRARFSFIKEFIDRVMSSEYNPT